jgi:hypothetical protein
MRCLLLHLLALVLCIFIAPVCMATEQSDITAALKALPLLTNKMTGDVATAILYDPSNSASEADAKNIKKIIDAGMQAPGGNKLSAILVSVHELGKLSRAKIAFLTPGLGSYLDDISTATSAASILTFSTDIDCVRAGKCIIGITTSPSLTIYYSKPAAEAAKIEFSQNFSMLVKQP